MTYRFITDPGHGWLEVPRAELDALGITNKISQYSYQRADLVYLEEDCDFAIFHNGKTAKGEGSYFDKIERVHQENTFVRNLPRYQP
jgi:hypothetical protein